jgi:hypothetical protein
MHNDDEIKSRHALSESEQRHIAEVRAQIDTFEADILRLKGAIWDRQGELSFMRRHLSLYIGNIATDAGLPMGSQLSQDGAAILARGNGV